MTKFTRTQKFTKTNIAKVPKDKAIVYKIKNAKGDNLYTGIAGRGRVQDRLEEHKQIDSEKISGGTHFQFIQVKNKDRAKIVEEQIIRKEQPTFNKQNK